MTWTREAIPSGSRTALDPCDMCGPRGDAEPAYAVLGAPAVRTGTVLREVSGRGLTVLFCLLVLAGGAVVEPGRLVDALWDADRPLDPEGALQSLVSRLRRSLEVPVLRSVAGYRLGAAGESVDAVRFERLVTRARSLLAAGAYAAARDEAVTAAAMWRGEPFGEAQDVRALRAPARRLGELRLEADVVRLEAEVALGLHHGAVHPLRALVGRHPLREDLWELLMLALYRAGRPADALRAYRAARATLDRELGLEPGPQLRALERAILGRSPEIDAPPHPCAAHARALAGAAAAPRPLELPPPVGPDGPAHDWAEYPAARRFLDRLRAADPRFVPTAHQAAQIVTLCRLLDGDPLAIELSAGLVPRTGLSGQLVRQRLGRLAAETMGLAGLEAAEAQTRLASGRSAPASNRAAVSGRTSTGGSTPSTRSRMTSPTAGPCRKP